MTYPPDQNQPPNPYQPPQYGPPGYPTPGYSQPVPVKKKSHLGLIIGVVAGVVVLCCGGGIIAVGSSKPKPVTLSGAVATTAPATLPPSIAGTTQPPVPSPVATTTQPAPPPPPATTDPAPPAPKTLLTLKGSGIKKSQTFTTGDEWTLKYRFDCSRFGGQGNFIVSEFDSSGSPTDVLVNDLASNGNDQVPQHADSGPHYLEMNSECSWTITVLG